MMITFTSALDDQRLSILDYNETKTNVRYKAVINEDQAAVLHLQTVDTEDTQDVSQLSLCPGVLRRICILFKMVSIDISIEM